MRFFMSIPIFNVISAVVLDFIFGDPVGLWHPVVGIGKLVYVLEGRLYQEEDPPALKKKKGILLAMMTTGTVALLVWSVLVFSYHLSVWMYRAASIYFLWMGLAGRTLKLEGMKVYTALSENKIQEARTRISYLVTRQTEKMTEEDVVKAAVETVSENTSDGILAPLFIGVLLGPCGMWIYKAVNTLDSMVGYKNKRYLQFGWFSAKADDVLNFIPARLTAYMLLLSAPFEGRSLRRSFKVYRTYRNCHESPNAGHSEAAVAGVLGISLGGEAVYFGQPLQKPQIGDPDKKPEPSDILITIRMMERSYILGTCFLLILTNLWR